MIDKRLPLDLTPEKEISQRRENMNLISCRMWQKLNSQSNRK